LGRSFCDYEKAKSAWTWLGYHWLLYSMKIKEQTRKLAAGYI